MKNLFKRKRCFQCGEPLRLFEKLDFCSYDCCKLYRQIEKEYLESRKKIK